MAVLGFGGGAGPCREWEAGGAPIALWGPERTGNVLPVGHTWSTYLLGVKNRLAWGALGPCSHGVSMVKYAVNRYITVTRAGVRWGWGNLFRVVW